jgi:hypothetical protein
MKEQTPEMSDEEREARKQLFRQQLIELQAKIEAENQPPNEPGIC